MRSLSIILAAGAIGAGIAGAAVFFKNRMQRKTSWRSQEEVRMQEAVSGATWQDILDLADCPPTGEKNSKGIRCSDSDVVKDTVVFACKIKKGCMGRIIGKKGCKLKHIKSVLHVDYLHGTLDEKYSFLRLEGAADDVKAAKEMAYQSIQTGIVEIAPTDIENRIVNEDDIVTENLYHVQTQHGRVVGQNGTHLKQMRSLGVAVSTSTEHHLKVLTIKGTPKQIQDVHRWIENNIAEKNLFVPAPGLPAAVRSAQGPGNAPAIESA